MNESVTEVFVEQPLASPGSANYMRSSNDLHMDLVEMLGAFCTYDPSYNSP